jgi:hypothetical protein
MRHRASSYIVICNTYLHWYLSVSWKSDESPGLSGVMVSSWACCVSIEVFARRSAMLSQSSAYKPSLDISFDVPGLCTGYFLSMEFLKMIQKTTCSHESCTSATANSSGASKLLKGPEMGCGCLNIGCVAYPIPLRTKKALLQLTSSRFPISG